MTAAVDVYARRATVEFNVVEQQARQLAGSQTPGEAALDDQAVPLAQPRDGIGRLWGSPRESLHPGWPAASGEHRASVGSSGAESLSLRVFWQNHYSVEPRPVFDTLPGGATAVSGAPRP